jgi:hypothetical protein
VCRLTSMVVMAFLAIFAAACTPQDESDVMASQSSASEDTTEQPGDPYGAESDIFFYDPDPQPTCDVEGSITTDDEIREIGNGVIAYGYNNYGTDAAFGDVSGESAGYALQVYPDAAHPDTILVEIVPDDHGGWAVVAPTVFSLGFLRNDLEVFSHFLDVAEDGSGGSLEVTFVSESGDQEVKVVIDSMTCATSG